MIKKVKKIIDLTLYIKNKIKSTLKWNIYSKSDVKTLISVLSVFFLNKVVILIPTYIAIHKRLRGLCIYDAAVKLLLDDFTKWDAKWYSNIAALGYYSKASAAFFPFYPLLSKAIGNISGIGTIYAGYVISNLAFISAIYLGRRLLLLDYEKRDANRIILLMALFPTSFYFSAYYTESLFLMTFLLSLYAMRKKKWALAGIGGFFAAMTRNTGIFLVIPFVIEYLVNEIGITYGDLKKPFGLAARIDIRHSMKYRKILWVIAIPSSTGLYMLYLQRRFGDPLAFKDSESYFHRYSMNPFICIFRGIFETISKSIGHSYPKSTGYYYLYVLAFTLLALITLVLSVGKIRFSYWAVMLLSIMIPLSEPYLGKLNDYFTSFPRYMLVIFPVYIGIYEIIRRKTIAYIPLLFYFGVFLAISTYLWSRGIWIA